MSKVTHPKNSHIHSQAIKYFAEGTILIVAMENLFASSETWNGIEEGLRESEQQYECGRLNED